MLAVFRNQKSFSQSLRPPTAKHKIILFLKLWEVTLNMKVITQAIITVMNLCNFCMLLSLAVLSHEIPSFICKLDRLSNNEKFFLFLLAQWLTHGTTASSSSSGTCTTLTTTVSWTRMTSNVWLSATPSSRAKATGTRPPSRRTRRS